VLAITKSSFWLLPSIEVECASLSTVHGVQPEPVEKESAVMTEMLALIGAPDSTDRVRKRPLLPQPRGRLLPYGPLARPVYLAGRSKSPGMTAR